MIASEGFQGRAIGSSESGSVDIIGISLTKTCDLFGGGCIHRKVILICNPAISRVCDQEGVNNLPQFFGIGGKATEAFSPPTRAMTN